MATILINLKFRFMKLVTNLNYKGSIISTHEDNNNTIITGSVKITNKRKQSAMNKLVVIEDEFMKLASIERAKDRKRNFFAKHKNKK